MNFRSYGDLAATIAHWQEELPRDVTLVCGIPRSGLMVANLFALQWNLPVTDVEGLLAGRVLGGGRRLGLDEHALVKLLDKPQSILVIEDSVAGGTGIRAARARLAALGSRHTIRYAAVYAAPEGRKHVDYAAEIVPMPRVFEWNLFHHPLLNQACVDIDGVLCRDPSEEENDDGPQYKKFLREAELRHRPSEKIGWLVTSRLEKYRTETEAWLLEQRISYGQLLMLDLPDMQTRRETGAGAAFKAEHYVRTGARMFIESNTRQAAQIAERTGKLVLATDTMQLLAPGGGLGKGIRVVPGRNGRGSKWPRRAARLWRRCCEGAGKLLQIL